MPRTIKKARNQALHPIAARWVAPGELFVRPRCARPYGELRGRTRRWAKNITIFQWGYTDVQSRP